MTSQILEYAVEYHQNTGWTEIQVCHHTGSDGTLGLNSLAPSFHTQRQFYTLKLYKLTTTHQSTLRRPRTL